MPMWEEQCVTVGPPLDVREFRNALSAFPTGVCVITTRRPDGKREGLTASSFNTVSLAPPMVLWSLTRSSPSADAFRNCEYFAINVLAETHQALSSHFARRCEDKFQGFADHFTEGLGGVPVLRDAVASFECRNSFQNYGGDHIVFIGGVQRYQTSDRPPLVFHRGRYAQLASPAT